VVEIVYKIPYGVYKEYFDEEQTGSIRLNLWMNKGLLLLRKRPKIAFFLGLMVLGVLLWLFIKILGRAVSWLLLSGSGLVFEQLNVSLPPILSFTQTDLLGMGLLFFFVFFMFILVVTRLTAEWPFVLRDMVNDGRVIQRNFGKGKKPLESNRFSILAALKYYGDIRGFHRFIIGMTKTGSLSEAKQKLKERKINDVPLITEEEKYVPWKFEIVDGVVEDLKKKKIEALLGVLWENLLDIERRRIEQRKRMAKIK